MRIGRGDFHSCPVSGNNTGAHDYVSHLLPYANDKGFVHIVVTVCTRCGDSWQDVFKYDRG